VGFVARIRNFRRWWRRYRVRLRRDRVAVTLLVLLTLGLGEPLLCIIHCQIWLPLAFHGYFAAQHHHDHASQHRLAAVAPMARPAPPAAGATVIGAARQPARAPCCLDAAMSTDASVPFHVPPSPVHDMMLALTLLVFTALLFGALPNAPPVDPPPRSLPPPLRPPIPVAA